MGNEKLLNGELPAIAVVGSRKASEYGRYVTQTIVGELSATGLTIVSGLALGIDGLAHKATLGKLGKTIAVLPCGLDAIYPASHRDLAKNILEDGGLLISEYPEGTPPLRQHFPARNRIVSGLADGVIIIEAAIKSGSLITANFALEQGINVMAVPGNINNHLSMGTNNLIKVGAHPITSAKDVLDVCGLADLTDIKDNAKGDNPSEQIIIDLLKSEPMSGDLLRIESELDTSDFNQALTMLEIKGTIKNLGANIWSL